MKRVFFWIGSILFIALVVFVVVELATLPRIEKGALVLPVSERDWSRDGEESETILVEYSDFQCPACGAYYPLLKKLHEEFGDKIRFVYRHFPLDQHKNALGAAMAAEAAGKQGKFWEMHDLIFENQGEWSENREARGLFEDYAESLALDPEIFSRDLDDSNLKEKIEADRVSGVRSGVRGTPTFFLNGLQIQNPQNYDEFRKLIEASVASNS